AANGGVTLKAGDSIYSADPETINVKAASATISAGVASELAETTGTPAEAGMAGTIGSHDAPLTLDGTLRVEAPGDIYLANPHGELTVERVVAGGDVNVWALGSLWGTNGGGVDTDGGVNVVGDTVTLRSIEGWIGSAERAVGMDSN